MRCVLYAKPSNTRALTLLLLLYLRSLTIISNNDTPATYLKSHASAPHTIGLFALTTSTRTLLYYIYNHTYTHTLPLRLPPPHYHFLFPSATSLSRTLQSLGSLPSFCNFFLPLFPPCSSYGISLLINYLSRAHSPHSSSSSSSSPLSESLLLILWVNPCLRPWRPSLLLLPLLPLLHLHSLPLHKLRLRLPLLCRRTGPVLCIYTYIHVYAYILYGGWDLYLT